MSPLLVTAIGGGISALLGFIFFPYIQIARGELVSRKFLDDEIAEKNIWRKTAGDKDKVIADQSSQLGEYMETTRVARLTMEAVHRAATS